MSGEQRDARVDDLLRQWQRAAVPVEDREAVELRRARAVQGIRTTIQRGARERASRRRRRRIGAAAAAAVALAAAGASWKALGGGGQPAAVANRAAEDAQRSSGARLLAAHGGAVALRGGSPLSRTGDVELEVGDEVRTRGEGRAVVGLGLAARVQVGPSARLKLLEAGSGFRIRLDAGRVEARVEAGGAPSSLVVQTPDAEVVVRGTVFSVAADEVSGVGPRTVVQVSRGWVSVLQDGRAVAQLRAGDRWASAVRSAAAKPATAEPPPSVSPPPSAERPAGGSPRRPVDGIGGSATPGSAEARAKGTLAEQNALFQAAIAARNRGDQELAVELLERFLRHHPHSPLAQEARVEQLRALRQLGRDEEAAQSARRYLAEHPDGFAGQEARELVIGPAASGRAEPGGAER